MLVTKPAVGALPPAHAIRRVRAASFSASASISSPVPFEEHQQPSRRTYHRRFTTVSAHASAPARPTLLDAHPSTPRCSKPAASISVSATYVAPSNPTLRRQKSSWHSPSCTWSRQIGPRDKTCPGCAKEVASSEATGDLPYEFSPREALWQQHLNEMKDFIHKDPYEAMFGFSNRLLKGQGLPLGWWEQERRSSRKAELVEPAEFSHEAKPESRERKDSGVEVLEATYSWSSSGYDTRTGKSWSHRADMVYDPIEGKMVPKSISDTPAKPCVPLSETSPSKDYDRFENQQQQTETDASLANSLKALETRDPSYSLGQSTKKDTRHVKAKQALEQGWVAEKRSNQTPSSVDESASAANAEFPGNSILSTQQREWERNLDNAERAANVRQAQKTVEQAPTPSPQAWKDFKAGKVAKPAAKPQIRSPLHTLTADNGSRFICMSILRKEKPLRHMNMRELGRHRAAVMSAFSKRVKAAEAAKVSTPAEKHLDDEVERQKLAMAAWEDKWRSRSPTATSTIIQTSRDSWSNTEQSTSTIPGEGDIDAKVVDFCTDSAGWYKRPAPHATHEAVQDKHAADTLVDEMRHIYESAYGVIDVHHRQGSSKLEASLQDFDEQPQPEKLDVALQKFNGVQQHETLSSALDEYEQRHEASAVDDALKVYEREPKEGLDFSLRQYEKHAAASKRYTFPPAKEQVAARPKVDAAEIQKASSVVSAWEPKVMQRLEPAIDRMPLKRAAKPRQTKASSATQSEEPQDAFTYEGEKQKFTYGGALEDCSSRSESESTEKAIDEKKSELLKTRSDAQRGLETNSAPWGVNPIRRARSREHLSINPIDGTTAPDDQLNLMPQTGNFASPTGFVNHDIPGASGIRSAKTSGNDTRAAARKVRRVEEVFSGAQPLQKESIPQIVEHFRRIGLGPELEAYARSSTLLDRSSPVTTGNAEDVNRNNTPHPPGSPPASGRGSDEHDEHSSGRRRHGGTAKTLLLTIPAVIGAMYAAGVVVEYFREEEEARRRRLQSRTTDYTLAPPFAASSRPLDAAHTATASDHEQQHDSDHDQRGWGPVLRTSSLRRRREAAAAAQRAAEDEQLRAAQQEWLQQQQAAMQEAQAWKKFDDDLRTFGRTLWAGVGAATAAIVLICSLGNGGS